MILDLKSIRGYSFQQPQEQGWHQKFIGRLIELNQLELRVQPRQTKPQPNIGPIVQFINQPAPDKVLEVTLPQYPHSYYSSFVPIRSQNYKWLSQFQKEYPFLTFLEDQDYEDSQDAIQGILVKNQACLFSEDKGIIQQTLNPKISMVERVYKRAQLLKHGTKIFKGCNLDQSAWAYSLSRADSYLSNKAEIKLRGNVDVTVESFENITPDVISRTMKNLYCPVCLIYDCPAHDALGANLQYVSKQNKISQQAHLNKAIKLISKLLSQVEEEDSPQCSDFCFKKKRQPCKTPLYNISSLAKSIIEIGVHLFSFEPCMISKLFKPSSIHCEQVYEFLISECSIFNRIDCKFYPSEMEMLKNEQKELVSASQLSVLEGKKRKKKKVTKCLKSKAGGKPICIHHFVNEPSQDMDCRNCECKKRGFCLPECLCTPNCPLMKTGCKCKVMGSCRSNQCPCFKNRTECHPGVCRSCCSEEKMNCKNLNILRKRRKNIRVGVSQIKGAGLGAYAGEFICKDELVTVYLGESVESYVEELRHSTTRDSSFYNFDTNGLALDARFIGNKARFINHGDRGAENLGVQILESQGQEWICFFALRDICEHEELYFDYDGTGELAKHHHEKYPFIANKKER